ncbi:MAG: SDR family oxidoreductase [Oribacterium sp.]|nr:SDR family oxidoreductase [Oribacterium sp.]
MTQIDGETPESLKSRIHGVVCDGTDESAVTELAKFAAGHSEDNSIAAWVNNIGTNKARAGDDYTDDELDYLISANFKATVFGTQAAAHYMKANGGSIVNIASLAARAATTGRSTIYAAMKAAVVQYSKTVAGEYGAYNIRVNALMPGYTLTPLVASTFTKEALDKLMENNLLGRMAEPEEVAKAVLFLASPVSSYITGTSLEISGGHNTVLNPEYAFLKKENE